MPGTETSTNFEPVKKDELSAWEDLFLSFVGSQSPSGGNSRSAIGIYFDEEEDEEEGQKVHCGLDLIACSFHPSGLPSSLMINYVRNGALATRAFAKAQWIEGRPRIITPTEKHVPFVRPNFSFSSIIQLARKAVLDVLEAEPPNMGNQIPLELNLPQNEIIFH